MNLDHARVAIETIGPEVATKHFGISPSDEQITTINEVPCGEDILAKHRGSHILVWFPGMSMCNIRDAAVLPIGDGGYVSIFDRDFAKKRRECGWWLIRSRPVLGSVNRSWWEQIKLLDESETVPSSTVIVYAMIAHYKETWEKLFGGHGVRCQEDGLLDVKDPSVTNVGIGEVFPRGHGGGGRGEIGVFINHPDRLINWQAVGLASSIKLS